MTDDSFTRIMDGLKPEDADWLLGLGSNIALSRSNGGHPLSWMARVAQQEREARAEFGDETVDAAIARAG